MNLAYEHQYDGEEEKEGGVKENDGEASKPNMLLHTVAESWLECTTEWARNSPQLPPVKISFQQSVCVTTLGRRP